MKLFPIKRQILTSVVLRGLTGSSPVANAARYILTLGVVTASTLLLQQAPLERPFRGVISMAVILFAAWFGGLGPSILLGPLLLGLSQLQQSEPEDFTTQQLFALIVISLVTSSVGLAGQFRRRIRTMTRFHEKKLRDQARALSLAHIVFRDVDGRISEWNESIEQKYGWTRDEAIGRNLHELLQTQFPVPLADIQRELLRSGQWSGELVHHRRDGLELMIASHWILYRDDSGIPVGVAEIQNDVSELRRAEAALYTASQRKDEFIAVLAHELRNPLAPIRAGLELMKNAADDPMTMELARNTLERQARQLTTLVDDLLDVSRITQGKLQLRKSHIQLADAITTAVEASRPLMTERQHELCITLTDKSILVDADLHRLAQVISNLLHNAAKYTPPGGRIELSTQVQSNDVVVAVADNGIGIPIELQQRIFEMFEQIRNLHEGGDAGLGVGLTLTKSIVEMHGGSIEVHSDGLGQGSVFRVRLPIVARSAEEAEPSIHSTGPVPPIPPRRVLVVDDNTAAVTMLSMLITTLGNAVRTASNGEEAIRVAAEFLPDLVFMDIGMPKLNGYEAARRIRQEPWGKDMTLIALTGWGQRDDRCRTKEAGFDGHLVKPADPAVLKRLIAGADSVLT